MQPKAISMSTAGCLKAVSAALAIFGLAMVSKDAAAQTPKRGGTLNFAVVAEPPNYDCHANLSFAHLHPIAPHYSLLVKFDAAKYPEVIGDLAKSWSVSADGLTYTFKLHTGVKFHDGTPLTSADVKASYERIFKPPQGVISLRATYYADFAGVEAPDAETVVFKTNGPVAGVMGLLASPFNCIYSAAKLAINPKYPETEVMGSGAFQYVEYVRGSHWIGKRFEGYFRGDRPYLDGYKAFFVKSPGVVPGMLGGQFDTEFRFRNPVERDQLIEKMGDKIAVLQMPLLAANTIVFNTQRKPFDDVRVRQAIVHAIDRWAGGPQLAKISEHRYIGGINRPGSAMALPEDELAKLPGYWKDGAKAKEEAKRLLKEAGQQKLSFKLLNRAGIQSYATLAVYIIDQLRRIGINVTHDPLETKLYLDAFSSGNYDVGIEFISDYLDDPTLQFTKFLSRKGHSASISKHDDTKIDELYEKQRRILDPVERLKVVNELERYSLTTATTQPVFWSERIVVLPKKIKGWYLTPSHLLAQDLTDVWLDQ